MLAEYLNQHGRAVRHTKLPPSTFWAAATRYANSGDLTTLATAANNRGLLREAAQLYKSAANHGDIFAAVRLVDILYRLHPDDQRLHSGLH